tara:strand:+ start:1544 stop:1798 length:255 start_codon:yes stop_codon:yes gene_type:complete
MTKGKKKIDYSKIVKKEISKVLKVSEKKIQPKTSFSTIKNWDSLAHINIVLNLQKKTGKKFKLDKIADLNTVENWVKFLNDEKK